MEQEMESICSRLLTLPDDTIVLPGHMEETSIEFEKRHNPFVLEWLMRRGDAGHWTSAT
jgi:glyoxylase-like metal-dependent hydrolase (beta-lactamase superfamily II)